MGWVLNQRCRSLETGPVLRLKCVFSVSVSVSASVSRQNVSARSHDKHFWSSQLRSGSQNVDLGASRGQNIGLTVGSRFSFSVSRLVSRSSSLSQRFDLGLSLGLENWRLARPGVQQIGRNFDLKVTISVSTGPPRRQNSGSHRRVFGFARIWSRKFGAMPSHITVLNQR